jgi:hypothetical protein
MGWLLSHTFNIEDVQNSIEGHFWRLKIPLAAARKHCLAVAVAVAVALT